MNAVKRCSNAVISWRENDRPDIDEVIAAVHHRGTVRIDVVPSPSHVVFGAWRRPEAVGGGFREGCIKMVESHIWPLSQRSRVLAEIHRRLDLLSEGQAVDRKQGDALISVYDYARAWALAARLIRSGLRVLVFERDDVRQRAARADVEIVLSADEMSTPLSLPCRNMAGTYESMS